MSESSLSIGLPELRSEVGYFLGFGRASWTANQLAEIDMIVQSGIRRVYFPPAVSADTLGYEWSWLRPTKTVQLEAGVGDYDLPDDFGRLIGALHYPAEEHRSSVVIVSVGKLLSMRAYGNVSDAPKYAAIRYKASDGTTGQKQEVLFYPKPNKDWELSYEYEAYGGALTDDFPYPLGGMKFGELYIESCLAIAESRITDEIGLHNQQYKELLLDAIARDRKSGARVFGQVGHVESVAMDPRRNRMNSGYVITYHGEIV